MPGQGAAVITVRFKWWVPLYLDLLVAFVVITGCEPDWDKVLDIVMKGTYVEKS